MSGKQKPNTIVVVATKCGICHETNGEHVLSCPTRWYK